MQPQYHVFDTQHGTSAASCAGMAQLVNRSIVRAGAHDVQCQFQQEICMPQASTVQRARRGTQHAVLEAVHIEVHTKMLLAAPKNKKDCAKTRRINRTNANNHNFQQYTCVRACMRVMEGRGEGEANTEREGAHSSRVLAFLKCPLAVLK